MVSHSACLDEYQEHFVEVVRSIDFDLENAVDLVEIVVVPLDVLASLAAIKMSREKQSFW